MRRYERRGAPVEGETALTRARVLRQRGGHAWNCMLEWNIDTMNGEENGAGKNKGKAET